MTENNSNNVEIEQVQKFQVQFRKIVHEKIVGYDSLIDLLTVAMLTNGHILIEGVPGTAKTTICKLFTEYIGGKFGRLQGTIDVQPADVLGFTRYSREGKEMEFRKGPIFSNIFLVDEVNRLSPKTQSALIEPLAERQVTIDSLTYPLPDPFLALASQNPYELHGGTFPLIDAQRDRFAYSVVLNPLTYDDEIAIIDKEMDNVFLQKTPKNTTTDFSHLKELVRNVTVSPEIRGYIADLVMATRQHHDIKFGSSTRGSIALLRGTQVVAAMNGRSYVIPDDVKFLVPFTLRHRISLKKEAELNGMTPMNVLTEILNSTTIR